MMNQPGDAKQMRILMLAQFYSPVIGGEETYVRNLSRALVQRGYSVAVGTSWSTGLPEYEEDNGVRIYRLRGLMQRLPTLYSEDGRRHAPPFPDPGMVWVMRQLLKEERPDLVHAHNWMVRSFIPLKASSKAKLIMSLHDYSLVCAKKNLVYKDGPCDGPNLTKCISCASEHYGPMKGTLTAVGNLAMDPIERAAVDMFIPVSQAVAINDRLENNKWPYQVIYNFMLDDADQLGEPPETYLSQLPKEPFLLFVGDIRHLKGADVLVRAYANLKDAPPLVLIGRNCPDTPTDLPPNVTLLHNWPHEAIMHAWDRCMIGICPSIARETFGYVVLEAITMGKPVVASRIGGIPEIVVDGESGFLVTAADVNELEQRLRLLIENPDLREQMGKAAKQRSRSFAASVIMPQIEQLYCSVLNEPVVPHA